MSTAKPFTESTLKMKINSPLTLRPQGLDHFIGQEALCKRLKVAIGAALKREEALGHTLFFGPPGLGKTTLANIISVEMGSQIVATSGPTLEKAGDLAGILTKLQMGDILFIDEIHRLQRSIEEYLYAAMEDFSLDLILDSGPHARSVQVKLQPFTLVGATTQQGLLSAPLRSRFSQNYRLDYYTPQILLRIVERAASLLDIQGEQEAFMEISKRSRGTPRIAQHLLRWVRDYLQMNDHTFLSVDLSKKALSLLEIDEEGLDDMDKKILDVMIKQFAGRPVGIKTLAIAVGEDPRTIEEVYEPFLITKGLIQRTPRGRVLTPKAMKIF